MIRVELFCMLIMLYKWAYFIKFFRNKKDLAKIVIKCIITISLHKNTYNYKLKSDFYKQKHKNMHTNTQHKKNIMYKITLKMNIYNFSICFKTSSLDTKALYVVMCFLFL